MMIRRVVVFFVLTGLVGCGSETNTNSELASAHEVLKTGLEAWKNGRTPASLETSADALKFSDSDWQAGAKLLKYRILKVGDEEEGETVGTVSLKMQVRGKVTEKSLSYRVTQTPKRAVSRYSPKG